MALGSRLSIFQACSVQPHGILMCHVPYSFYLFIERVASRRCDTYVFLKSLVRAKKVWEAQRRGCHSAMHRRRFQTDSGNPDSWTVYVCPLQPSCASMQEPESREQHPRKNRRSRDFWGYKTAELAANEVAVEPCSAACRETPDTQWTDLIVL